MRVTEVQVLKIADFPTQGKDSKVFHAAIDDTQYEPGTFWHEVSISSVQANKILLENTSLELGDKASWTLQILSNADAAQAMYLPACEMLKKMDGIGYYTENYINPSAAVPPPSKIEQEAHVPYQFW